MSASAILRLIATVCFVLAFLGVQVGAYPLVPVGLALWCGSTLV
jgi:hypothetical protein